jgi:hypothetical protein
MSRLPYLCHFRAIVHTYEGGNEVLDLSTWTDGFTFRSIKEYEKDKKEDLSDLLNHPSGIQILEGSQSYYNDGMTSATDYGKEILENGDMVSRIIEGDIKPDDEEHYYEIIGKLHYHSFQNYEGECVVKSGKYLSNKNFTYYCNALQAHLKDLKRLNK